MDGAPDPLPTSPLSRPLRVVLFCGPILERGMVRFARLLDAHPEIELAGSFCHTKGLGFGARLADLLRRRGVIAAPLLATQMLSACARWISQPGSERMHRRNHAWLLRRLHQTEDIHSPATLDAIRALSPDLGLIYGGPILKPNLFTIPRFGTLGIHHGRLPEYRGKKTTFWALYEGETSAGVTIQRVNEGVDTGQRIRSGEVPAEGRSYASVERDLEELGLDLYMDAVLALRDGRARAETIEGEKRRLYRDPKPMDLLRFALRRSLRGRGAPKGDGILLLTESYHPMKGGGENQARAMAAALAEGGRELSVVTRRWDPEQPAVARVDGKLIRRVPPAGSGHLKKWGLAWTAFPQIRAHRRSHPNLLVNGFRVLGIPAAVAARLFGLRVLLKADSVGEMSGEFFDAGLRRFGLSHRSPAVRPILSLRNRLLRGAGEFVAISAALAQEFERHGVARERIHLIPNGIDTEQFRPARPGEKAELREALGLPGDSALVIYTGRLVSYKGLPGLLRVWKRLCQGPRDATLILVGEGGEDIHNCEAELRAFVDEAHLETSVLFTGSVDNVEDYLRSSDLFVFPTEDEAFGLSAVEAMACALPVVSTRAGGLADFIAEENGALPFDAGDEDGLLEGLQRLLDDPAFAKELGDRACRVARERFGLAAVRQRYLQLIDGTNS